MRLRQKIANAQAAGAVGVIMFNEGDSAGRMNAGFRPARRTSTIPAVFSSFAVGKELYDAYKAGKNPTVRLETSGVDVYRTSSRRWSPRPRRGDPRHMVLAGAHLDSVPAGPGINDDGSGTAWQLDARRAGREAGIRRSNKIRFLWFGGEEDGLVGSQYYAAHLTQTRGRPDRRDDRHRHDRVAELRAARLRR